MSAASWLMGAPADSTITVTPAPTTPAAATLAPRSITSRLPEAVTLTLEALMLAFAALELLSFMPPSSAMVLLFMMLTTAFTPAATEPEAAMAALAARSL